MLEENRAQRVAGKRWSPGQAVEKRHAGRVQVRGLGHVVVDRAGLLGRKVERGVERLLARPMPFDVQRCRRLEFNQGRGRDRPLGVDDYVAGSHAAMQQLVRVHLARAENMAVATTSDSATENGRTSRRSLSGTPGTYE